MTTTRRVYVAASIKDVSAARAAAAHLRKLGHVTVSTWHETMADGESDSTDRQRRQSVAATSYRDLRQADTIVVIAHPDGRGSLMELATAYALGMTCFVIGAWQSITLMADRPGIRWIESVEALDTEEWSRNREAAE